MERLTSARLTIFEGPDGAGKTSLAQAYARREGASYVHLGPFPRVSKNLARLYVDALMPAVLGHQNMVLDRCWLSERPYGEAFRDGLDRLGPGVCNILERLAARCRTAVVLALPPWEVVHETFFRRSRTEMLQTVSQLRHVYDSYRGLAARTSLPVTRHDYTGAEGPSVDAITLHEQVSFTIPHPLTWATAGHRRGRVLLVGDEFARHTDADPLYQWPFGALGGGGCSRWLAEQLDPGLSRQLLWVNADRLTPDLVWEASRFQVVALGGKALKKLGDEGIRSAFHLPHPQSWKRFRSPEEYPLVSQLKELLA